MTYFVTGGTGFIGRFLVENLLKRGAPVHVLVRKESLKKLEALRITWNADEKQVIAVLGDLGKSDLGISDADKKRLKGKIKHMFHLAAVYDLNASAEDQQLANIDGTRNAVELAQTLQVGCFHHASSIAAAGLYEGTFREDMFEEAEELDHPYFRTKHLSEGIVRKECKRPWRIYRPAFVVGHSQTGYIDKIDGPYYFFKLIQRLRNMLPPWMPTIGIEGGRINIVPVDFVANAMDYLAHKKGLDGKCFHLTDPEPHRIGEVLNIFAKAAHAPQMTLRINARIDAAVAADEWWTVPDRWLRVGLIAAGFAVIVAGALIMRSQTQNVTRMAYETVVDPASIDILEVAERGKLTEQQATLRVLTGR